MKAKRLLALALAVVLVLTLVACGGKEEKKAVNAADASINVCLASEPDTIDPALNSAVDGATLLAHLFSGLAKWSQDDSGKLVIVPDAATELVEGVKGDDGKVTYTYTLRDGLKWSDGKDVTAADFAFAWQRAGNVGTGGDYYYMFSVVDGYSEEDANAKLNIKAIDDKTFEVVLSSDVPYWNELLAFPVYFPVREDVVADEKWATDPAKYVSNGMYTLDSWKHNSVITLKKNENHPDADEVTMGTINFYLSDDSNNMLANFKNGDWLLIDDIPTNEIATIKEQYPDEFFNVGQIGTYYVCWNVNENILPEGSDLTGAEAEAAKSEIRNAISLLIDRNYIIDAIAQGGQLPASSFVAMGLTDADGSQFYENCGVSTEFKGYFDTSADALKGNYDKAIEILKKYYDYDESTSKFTNFPTMTYLYNTSEAHQAIGEYIQNALKNVGITMKMENQEWNTFLNTRKAGNYSIARNGWLADYNDPICFLDMWTTASGNNDIQFGKGANADVKAYSLDITDLGYETKVENGTWAETYDVLIEDIKSCTDNDTRYKLMHRAEDMLMATGCITPIYYYTDQYMLSSKVKGFFSNPLGYKYFMYTTVEE